MLRLYRPKSNWGSLVKRSIKTMLVAGLAFFALTASASAHNVTVTGGVTCEGITVNWSHFPNGPFDLVVAFQDQAKGKVVTSPYIVVHLSGASGTKFIPAPAANGVDYRKALATWTADGGGSIGVANSVKSCNCKPKPPTTTTTPTVPTTTVTTPGQTVTTPGSTTTTPGQTVTVTKTVTVATPAPPAQTVTVTTPAPPAPPAVTVTVTTPGKTITKTKVKLVTKNGPIKVICPKGENGSFSLPVGKKNGLPVARCTKGHSNVRGAGVTG